MAWGSVSGEVACWFLGKGTYFGDRILKIPFRDSEGSLRHDYMEAAVGFRV